MHGEMLLMTIVAVDVKEREHKVRERGRIMSQAVLKRKIQADGGARLNRNHAEYATASCERGVAQVDGKRARSSHDEIDGGAVMSCHILIAELRDGSTSALQVVMKRLA